MRNQICFLCTVLISLTFGSRSFSQTPKSKPAESIPPKAADADAPLAEGWPKSTAPDEIEVKTYPAYRGAVAVNPKAKLGLEDFLFFSLFNHIQRNEIEMTSPVINTYEPTLIETPGSEGEATMEFVYRSSKIGKLGKDGETVKVVDHPSAKYVCLGVQGSMTNKKLTQSVDRLHKWLDEHKTEYVADGPPRRLGYHGPMTPVRQRLWEVQIPVKAVEAKKDEPKETPKTEPKSEKETAKPKAD